jgi:hypothetical protein
MKQEASMQQLPIVDGQMPMMEAAVSAPPTVRRRRTWHIVLILLFFAAVIPETIVTTSTSVAKMIAQPVSLIFLMLFYGLADLLIREALIRRHLGWVSLVLFGIAFGFINEGVLAGTWYTVKPDGYIYIGQINYAWAVALTVFHVFISVILPIAFIETIFPSRAGMPLLRRRGIVISAVLFLLLTAIFLFAPSYRPYRIVVYALALALTVIALRLPSTRIIHSLTTRPVPGLWKLRWAGFFTMLSYFLLIYRIPTITLKLAGPHKIAAQGADIALFLLFSALLLRIGRRWTAYAGWSLRHTLALITGMMAFSTLITVMIPVFWPALELFATIPFFVLLIALNLRLRRREKAIGGSTAHFLVNGDATHDEGDPQDFDGRRYLA